MLWRWHGDLAVPTEVIFALSLITLQLISFYQFNVLLLGTACHASVIPALVVVVLEQTLLDWIKTRCLP